MSYNDSVDLTITPDDGYIIDTITVDEADVKANVRRTAEKSYQLHLTEVQRDTKVTVTFTECPRSAPRTSLRWGHHLELRQCHPPGWRHLRLCKQCKGPVFCCRR